MNNGYTAYMSVHCVRTMDVPAFIKHIEELKCQAEEQRLQKLACEKGWKLIFGQPFIFDGIKNN